MKKSSIVLAVVAAMAAAAPAHALLVNNGNTLTDTDTGLTWLNLLATEGQSIGDVLSQMDPGEAYHGYRLASGAEVVTLWSHANFSTGSFTDPMNYLRIQALQTSIGITLVQQNGTVRSTWGLYDQGTPGLYASARIETNVSAGLKSSALTLSSVTDGLLGSTGTGVWLVSAPVPEPSTWALWAAGLGLIALRAGRKPRTD